jgi:hypothetical protein
MDNKIPAPALQAYIQKAVDADPKLYGGYSAELCVRTYFYWLCTSSSYKKVERETDLPKSNMKKIFRALRSVFLPMSEETIKTLTYDNRKEIADAEIDDTDFASTTVLVDGVTIRLETMLSKEHGDELMCKKEGFKPALYLLSLPLWTIRFCMFHGRRHDITAFRDTAPLLKRKFHDNDVIMTDAGFKGDLTADGQWNLFTPHKKPRRGELTALELD